MIFHNNMILFQNVTFTEFKPFDIPGLNFNDKFKFGFESNENIDVAFNSKDKGIDFDVKADGVVITSPDKSYDATNEGYAYMSLIGKITSLFADKEETTPIFPRTKVKAVSDDNGNTLDVILDNRIPQPASADNGKFLRVVDGNPTWSEVQNAEEVSV